MILFHCPHGIILDVEVLNGAESPVIIFNMIMRFMPEAPGLIVYDNATERFTVDNAPARPGDAAGAAAGASTNARVRAWLTPAPATGAAP